jgi:hypothetical protein
MAAYLAACLTLLVLSAGAASINLQAYITFSLLTSNASSPLADGSVVYIIGSKDGIADPMQTYGGPETNYIANSVTGDDIIIGVTTVYAADLNSNGTFYAGEYYYDDALVDYLYIRFFDSPGPQITGMVNWAISEPPTNVGDIADCCGLSTIEVDFIGNIAATNYNNFVVIPEPSTVNLVVMCGGMLSALGAFRRRGKRASPSPDTPGDLPSNGGA